MPTVKLENLDGQGSLTYEEQEDGTINYRVDTKEAGINSDVERFLDTKREFKIPESNDEDDYRIDVAKPTDELTYFELALSTLYASTGIKVGW